MAFDASYVTTVSSSTNADTYNFSDSYGAADASRVTAHVVCGRGNSGPAISSVTVNGNAGTVRVSNNNGNTRVGISTAPNASGTTGTTTVVFAASVGNAAIHPHRLIDAEEVPTATASDNTISANALSADLTIPTGGAGIGGVYGDGVEGARTWAWTNLTDNVGSQVTVEGDTSTESALSTTAGAATRTATASGSLNDAVLALAAFEPSSDPVIEAGVGAYTLSGQAAGLQFERKVTANAGAYALAGQDVVLDYDRGIAAGVGAYVLDGQAVGLMAARVIYPEAGAYLYSGQAAGLDVTMPAAVGAYVLSGQDVRVAATRYLAAAAGSYTYTGQAAGLDTSLLAQTGSYVLTGQDAELVLIRKYQRIFLTGRQETTVELEGRRDSTIYLLGRTGANLN